MAKIKAGFNEKTGKWRWVPKVWHLTWSSSPSGPTYFITTYSITEPASGGECTLLVSWSRNEHEAIAFTDQRVAEGYALAMTHLTGTRVLAMMRWNGYPPVRKEKVIR